MRSSARRRGFILPTTLMVVTLLTVMLTAAFILISAESRTTDNSFANQRALAIAEAGLQQFLATSRSITGSTWYDSTYTSYTFTNGYAAVGATKLVDTTQGPLAIWLVRSYGYVTDPRLGGQPQARRVVAQLAIGTPGSLPIRAALVSGNATTLTGLSTYPNPIDGHNSCGGSDTVALAIAAGDYSDPTGGTSAPYDSTETFASRAILLDSTHINWAQLLAGDFTPDYVVTSASWPAVPSGYPVYGAAGNLTTPTGTRYGILVATGDITLNGTQWYGIIVAGGRIILPASSAVYGAVITGLNNMVSPGSVGANQIDRQNHGITWDSCSIANVTASLGSLTPLNNAWIDTWSTY